MKLWQVALNHPDLSWFIQTCFYSKTKSELGGMLRQTSVFSSGFLFRFSPTNRCFPPVTDCLDGPNQQHEPETRSLYRPCVKPPVFSNKNNPTKKAHGFVLRSPHGVALLTIGRAVRSGSKTIRRFLEPCGMRVKSQGFCLEVNRLIMSNFAWPPSNGEYDSFMNLGRFGNLGWWKYGWFIWRCIIFNCIRWCVTNNYI